MEERNVYFFDTIHHIDQPWSALHQIISNLKLCLYLFEFYMDILIFVNIHTKITVRFNT